MVSRYDPEAEPTIWTIPDALWEECRPLLPPEKPPGTTGRPAVPFRTVLDGILHVLRTGCQWKAVPPVFGSGSTCHRRFQEWVENGTWERLWRDQLERYDTAHGIGWDWQSTDSATVPSPPRRRGHRTRSDQPGETGNQAAYLDRPTWGAPERRPQRGQSDGHEGGRSDLGRGRTPAPYPHTWPPPALVPGQRLRLR
jgi:transposase